MKIAYIILLGYLALLMALPLAHSAPLEGQKAPAFALTGLDGQVHSLGDYQGKKTVLFFFCGCEWCHQTARAWALIRRSGRLSESVLGPNIATVVVYAGGPAEASHFADQTGLDLKSTTVLLDQKLTVSSMVYAAEPCPRVFVLSPQDNIVYTNDHPDDIARKVSARAVVQKVVAALGDTSRPALVASLTTSAGSLYLTPVYSNPSAGETLEAEHTVSYKFGTAGKQGLTVIEHDFVLRNDNKIDIVIDRIQPTCGCTNAFVDGTDIFPMTVHSGASVTVTVTVDPSELYPGAVVKSAMVFRAGQFTPMAVLEIDGTLTP